MHDALVRGATLGRRALYRPEKSANSSLAAQDVGVDGQRLRDHALEPEDLVHALPAA